MQEQEIVSDETLMSRFIAGDSDAFPALYQRHKNALYAFLLRQVSPAVVDELFQDVWEKVISQGEGFRQDASFRSWLYTIARNKVVDHWRSRKTLQTIDDQDLLEPADTEHAVIHQQTRHRIRDCLAKLPLYQREAVLLKASGLSVKELAAVAGVGFETAKSRLKLAYRQLRLCLEVCRESA